MRKFIFKWRRKNAWLWRTQECVGFQAVHDGDRMIVYIEGGGVLELPHWKECECRLGTDWVLATKEVAEREAGQKMVMGPGIA